MQYGGGFCRPRPVAVHHQVPAHQDFAVWGDPSFDPWQRRPDGFDADGIGRVGCDHWPGLGLAVALQQLQAHRQEEASDIRFQPCPARDQCQHPSAEARPQLCTYQSIQRAIRQPCHRSQAFAVQPAQPQAKRHLEQALAQYRRLGHLRQDAPADHVQHARHHGHDGWAHGSHVGGQVFHAAGIDHLCPQAEQEELTCGVFIAVRQWQERQIDMLANGFELLDQRERAPTVGADGAMRQHHSARRTAGAGGVDQAGQRAIGDQIGFSGDVVTGALICDQIGPAQQVRGRDVPWFDQNERFHQTLGQNPCSQRRGGYDGNRGAAVAQHMGVIGRGVGDVGRNRHGTYRHQGGFSDRVVRPVF